MKKVVRTLRQITNALQGKQFPVDEKYVKKLIDNKMLAAEPANEKNHYFVNPDDIERIKRFIQYPGNK